MLRYAHQQDSNSKEIDKALEAVPGLTIEKLGNFKIDRLVGYRGKNYLFEYKTPEGLKKNGQPKKGDLKDYQIKFIQTWTGPVNIVRDARDALFILGVIK